MDTSKRVSYLTSTLVRHLSILIGLTSAVLDLKKKTCILELYSLSKSHINHVAGCIHF